MLKFFEMLIDGCWHRWEETERVGVHDNKKVVVGYAVFCRCAKCGTPRRFNLY